jgi:hypothetical protein
MATTALALTISFVLSIIVTREAMAQVDSPKMTFNHPVAFAISPPLRELAKLPVRNRYVLYEHEPLSPVNFHPGRVLEPAVDPVEQNVPGGPSNISIGLSVPGVGRDPHYDYPGRPDTNAAVGDTQIAEWVNVRYGVFDKRTGALQLGPLDGNLIWQNLGGGCYEYNDGDPIVQWDKVNHRWLLAQNDFGPLDQYRPPYYACVAVSTSSDATGTYYLYQFPLGLTLPDYPKWGIWPSGYFQTQNDFSYPTYSFAGAYVCAYNSVKLLVGDPSAEQICVQTTPNDYGLLPADADSPTPPPANQDEFFIGSYDVDQTNNHLYLYSMHPDFANPSQSSFTGAGAANPITVPVYSPFCPNRGNQDCVPQEGTITKLASLGDLLMYRMAYWDDGVPSHVGPSAGRIPAQHWYVNHVATASGGQAGVRWYEFRAPVRRSTISDVSLFQSGTFAPDLNYRWMASIAQDKMGDVALGYSIASATMWDSIAATGRVPTDPLGQMEAEIALIAGTGSQNLDDGWGDYSSMAIDADGCTLWYAQEYYVTPASTDWQTSLTSFKFNGCQ